MAEISIQIEGLQPLLTNLDKFPATVRKEVGMEVQASAITIQRNAWRASPINLGALRAGIVYSKVDDLNATVVSGVNYSAYIEAGTGAFVSIPAQPPEADAILLEARGTGIRRVNRHAHPYFFPAINLETPLLIERVTAILEESTGIPK